MKNVTRLLLLLAMMASLSFAKAPKNPTDSPTPIPTSASPTTPPTVLPTLLPTVSPTLLPTVSPTRLPTVSPTLPLTSAAGAAVAAVNTVDYDFDFTIELENASGDVCTESDIGKVMRKLVFVLQTTLNFYLASKGYPGEVDNVQITSYSWGGRRLGEGIPAGYVNFSVKEEFADDHNRILLFVWKADAMARCRGCPPANSDYRRILRHLAASGISKDDISAFVNKAIQSMITLNIKYSTSTNECKNSADTWSGRFLWV